MGEMNRQTVIISTTVSASAARIIEQVENHNLHMIAQDPTVRSSLWTIVITPSGSKFGWDDDQAYCERVEAFLDWLEAKVGSQDENEWIICDYVQVNYGVGMMLERSIDLPTGVMRHSKYVGEEQSDDALVGA